MPKSRIEYHRSGIALLPAATDKDPGMAILVADEDVYLTSISCNCRKFRKKKNCDHKSELTVVADVCDSNAGNCFFDEEFRNSLWFRLAEILNDVCGVDGDRLRLKNSKAHDSGQKITVLNGKTPMLVYCANTRTDSEPNDDEGQLFLERTGLVPENGNPFHRGRALKMLSALTRTQSESILNEKNLKSRRQALEESFWYRLAYHCGNAVSLQPPVLEPKIDTDGTCVINCDDGCSRMFELFVPRDRVLPVLRALNGYPAVTNPIRFLPESMESILKVSADKNNDLSVSLYLLFCLADGTMETMERRRLKNFWFGEALYVPEHHIISTWRKPDRFWGKFGGRYWKKLRRDRIPELIENIEDVFSPPNIIDERVRQMAVFRNVEHVTISPSSLERDWCWLSIDYGFGDRAKISLTDIYQAKLSGKRYVAVDGGWVDTRAIDLETILGGTDSAITRQLADARNQLRFSRADLLRLQAGIGKPVEISSEMEDTGTVLQSLLKMVPLSPVPILDGLASVLRNYQHQGVEWLIFLFENGFGGILCDEMGLGKTHQVMGMMVWLLTIKKENGPFLVICPTTVISHWRRKIQEHAPALCPEVYHGADRDLSNGDLSGKVLITSYGILMRDIDRLSKINFSLAAFDEAQFIKNADTKTYGAASRLQAAMKVAVTGTPIENRLGDLKALMDLTVPGYLGTGDYFSRRYETEGINRLKELRQIVSPFTLRRTKEKVLSELPEKIEDIRFCRLTETQVRLYRDAVDARRKGLLQALEHEDEAIPYIHIFALLTLLKQICNHPESIAKKEMNSIKGPLDSGKWELFTELLDACLENGQKVVVFSQFVKMIEMINRYLAEKSIGFAGITGQTRDRAREIDRFNEDDRCRVFAGSLKAGGSGIDLIAGSVVIHYDRWWNAAKEDQATDRVHRIGQTRGVQVFKLVTEGTLEEKISAIIERKKQLMTDVIKEDDPGVLKTFTRDELIDLLALPEQSY